MDVFQFQQKMGPNRLGFVTYRFVHPEYKLQISIQNVDGKPAELLYPVTIKAVGPNMDITPDIVITSESSVEIQMPPSIPISRLGQFQECIEEIPALLGFVKDSLEKIQKGDL